MVDTTLIESGAFIRPKGVTLIRRDPTPNQPIGLSARERINQYIEAVGLVSTTERNADKFRPDVTSSLKVGERSMFTKNPVPRGNIVTDHSYRMPTTVQFEGIITETPFRIYTGSDLGLTQGLSRVSEQLALLYQFYESREPLFMASSIKTIDGMGISSLSISKGKSTGAAVEVSITLDQVLFVAEVRDEPIADTLAAQLGSYEAATATSNVGGFIG